MPRLQIPEKLLPLLKPKRFKIAIGGRGGGKSQSVGDIFLMKAETEQAKVGCFREFQNSIEDSVHGLLTEEVDRLGLSGFTTQNNVIKHSGGGEFKFGGLARNPHSIKSKFGFNYFWVEEAQTISDTSLKLLIPTLREANSELWLTLNPQSSADPVSQRFIVPFQQQLERDGIYEDELHTIVVINWRDNPWFPDVLENDRQHDFAHLSRAEYDHIWEGKFNDSVPDAIIPAEWFDAAIDAHVKLGWQQLGVTVVSHDPSDLGPDDKGLAVRQGSLILDVLGKDNGDVNEGCRWATDRAIADSADGFVWDADGMGIALREQVAKSLHGKRCDFNLFRGSETPDNPDEIYEPLTGADRRHQRTNRETFRNKRSQYYWGLRDRFYATYRAVEKGEYLDPDKMISLSSEIGRQRLDKLRAEVCRIPLKKMNNGLIQIMSKEDMAKLQPPIPSPNLADALMMCFAYTPPLIHNATPVFTQPTPQAGAWT